MKLKHYSDEHTEFSYLEPEYEINTIHPLLEFKRHSILNKLDKLYKKIVGSKHSINALLLNAYSYNKNKNDPVLIQNIDSTIIKNATNKTLLEPDLAEINRLLDKGYNKLLEYSLSDEFNDQCSLSPNVQIVHNNDKIIFIYNEYEIVMADKVVERIKKQQIHKIPNNTSLNMLLWCSIYRYKMIGLYTPIQLAIPSKYYNNLSIDYHAQVELFGSIINHQLPYYCGLFYDFEKYFGNVGQHFNLSPRKGFFVMNPPFENAIMEQSVQRLLEMLKQSNKTLTYLITIPIWDKVSRRLINEKCRKKVKIFDYDEFFTFTWLKKSEYLQYHRMYCQDKFYYIDYISYKKIYAAPTHLLVLQNIGKFNKRRLLLDQIESIEETHLLFL
jgi:hypothetical protein